MDEEPSGATRGAALATFLAATLPGVPFDIAPASADCRAVRATSATCSAPGVLATLPLGLPSTCTSTVSASTSGRCGAIGGLDAIVFTAGVGEHSAEVRDAALACARPLGGLCSTTVFRARPKA